MNVYTLPWRTLRAQRVRSVLTILGIAVAVGAFIALTGLTRGIQHSFESGIGEVDADFVVSQRNTYSLVSSSVSQEFGPALAAVEGVEEVAGVVLTVAEVDETANIFVTGWPEDSFLWRSLTLHSGRLPQSDRELVLGLSIAQALGKGVGDEIILQYEDFVISGLSLSDSVFSENIAITILPALQELLGRPGTVSLFQVRMTRPLSEATVAQTKARLAEVSPLLDVNNSAEFVGNMQFEQTLGTIASAVSLVMILASSILVANTLLMSVSERRQEFGILAAIGWTPGMIRSLVVAEGLMLCMFGSLLGIGIGIGAMYAVSVMRVFAGLLEPYITVAIITQAVGWVCCVGTLAAFYPAWRVTQIAPSAAIRGLR